MKAVDGYRVEQHSDGRFTQLHRFDVIRISDGAVVNDLARPGDERTIDNAPLTPRELDKLLKFLAGKAPRKESKTMANQDNGKGTVPIKWLNKSGSFMFYRTGPDGAEELVSVKAGETFQAAPADIPLAFRDALTPVNPSELEAQERGPEIVPVPAAYKLVPAGLPGKYDVVDGQGKKVNEKAMTKGEAQTLVEGL